MGKEQGVEEGKKATGKKSRDRGRASRGAQGRGFSVMSDDRGIILLGNFELHYNEPCTVSARGQLHAHCMTPCVDTANVNRGASEQVIVCVVCFRQYD